MTQVGGGSEEGSEEARSWAPRPSPLDAAFLAGLLAPSGHPHDASAAGGVREIQTHISWVFLTGERVYKFRKPVAPGFLDFTSRELRNADCLREIELNRRLAPDVYLGVAPLLQGPGGAFVGPVADRLTEGAEHCVVMRRLSEGGDAHSMLSRGELTAAHVERVAHCMARFHASHGLGAPAPFEPEAWREHCVGAFHASLGSLAKSMGALLSRSRLQRLSELARRFEGAAAACFEQRRLEGRAVDGHGDLHLQHAWFEAPDADPLVIDCIEFDDGLRRIDAASEVAFFAMDLWYRNEHGLAERFLREYAAASDDFGLYAVVDYFIAYRAAVRAKVAALAAADAGIEASQRERATWSVRRHLDLALHALDHREPGTIVLVCGVVGTGKSTVAAALADALEGPVVASDRVRKQCLGIAPHERAPDAAYAPADRAAVYRALLERAEPALASGRSVVLDATFGERAQREAVLERAQELGLRAYLIEVGCAETIARERLVRRQQAGSVSDAGPELLAPSLAGFEAPSEWPQCRHRRIDTGEPGWREAVPGLAEWIHGRGDAPTH